MNNPTGNDYGLYLNSEDFEDATLPARVRDIPKGPEEQPINLQFSSDTQVGRDL